MYKRLKFAMELCTDNWRTIFEYLSSNDLLLLGTTNTYLHKLVTNTCGKLNYNPYELAYRDDIDLLQNYLIPLLGQPSNNEMMSYCAGLGNSVQFMIYLSNEDKLIRDKFVIGALRSGNLDFVKFALSNDFDYNYYQIFIHTVRSMSPDIVKYIKDNHTANDIEFSLFNILGGEYGKVEMSLGLKFDLKPEYLDFLITEDFVDLDMLFTQGMLLCNDRIVDYCIKKEIELEPGHLHTAFAGGNMYAVHTILKHYPELIDYINCVTVGSVECYDYVVNHNLSVDESQSMIHAVIDNKRNLISHLYKHNIKFTDANLIQFINIFNECIITPEMLEYLISLGYKIPQNIYNLIGGNNIYFSEEFFYLFDKYLTVKPVEASIYLSRRGFELFKKSVELGYPIHTNIYNHLAELPNPLQIVEYVFGLGIPACKNICDIYARNGKLDVLEFWISKGYKANGKTIEIAAKRGFVHIVKFLIDKVKVKMSNIMNVFRDGRYLSDSQMDIMPMLINNYASHYSSV